MSDASATEVAARLVAEFEGFVPAPYLCPAGVWTIGYGTTRIDGRPVDAQTLPVDHGRALALLRNDLLQAARDVDRLCRMPLTTNQRAALISFVHNLGSPALQQSSLLRQMKNGRMDAAAGEFNRWIKGGGRTLPGLVRRRAAERALFEA